MGAIGGLPDIRPQNEFGKQKKGEISRYAVVRAKRREGEKAAKESNRIEPLLSLPCVFVSVSVYPRVK